ncbi:soluble scavenger receptor cysteine-rich domain-containing protein SSC5D isoform X4 [Lacerta agilis]|uniref:soluble scavenger receptor cysteine-rich domain-containing protein SSC5D isoform X4 n=1 Tax=Lacerta agilis TaxID=80427 RepID=UPI001419F93A|nr:soluble scavenger receptor cysteine-rich domain-containing protein SSC5D isoform X4 [Lacerta agilis]
MFTPVELTFHLSLISFETSCLVFAVAFLRLHATAQRFAPLTAFPPQPAFRWGKMKAVTTARPLISSTPAEGTPALRLVGGRSRCSGRLEVFHEGEWGTVCDDMWDLLDVAVVCRELDCGEALAAPGGAFFGEGSSVIWLDDVQCQGEESMLSECDTSLWGTTNCRHSEDAGAVCSGEMPLAMVEEHVAMLTRTLAPQRRRYVAPKRIPRPTQPTGNQEATVANEALQIEKSQKEAVPDGQWQVRLQGGPGSCAGRVEVLYQDYWGTVCDDGWDLVDAEVVCRELGCGAPLLSPGNARYGPGSGPIWLDDVNCTGAELTLQNCRSQPWGTHNCNHHEDASVICTGRWKRLSLPSSSSNSKIAAPATTMNPGQSILDVAETSRTSQEFSASWELEYPEAPFLTTQSVELELEKEQKQASPFNIIETTPNPETLLHSQEMESTNTPKTEPSTQKWGKELVYASVESLPTSGTLDLVSERETETISLWNMDKATANLEILQHVQGTESTSTPNTRPQTHGLGQNPTPSTAEFQPTLAMQELEFEKETESTNPRGTGLPIVAPGLTLATEVVQSKHWDTAFKVPSVQKVELTTPTATEQPTTSTSVQEPEKVNVIDHVVKELLMFSNILKAAREMDLLATTQSAPSVNHMESISYKSSHSEENTVQKQQEESNTYPHTLTPTEPTIAPTVLTSLAETDVHDTTVLLQSTVSHTVSMDGLLESLVSSGNTERGAGTTSAPGLIEAPGPNTTLTESVTRTATVSESSSDCPFRQDSRGKDQGCCCSPPGLENLVDAMTGLRGELGSLSTAIQHQGSQLEAVARSLAELAASVNHLVGVLPTLLQSAAAQSSSAQNTQDEGQMHNQLPLK